VKTRFIVFYAFAVALVIFSILAAHQHETTNAAPFASQGTSVGGYISANTTWTLDGSPYIVAQPVTVEEQATLIIEPGVEVQFANEGAGLWVHGALNANGKATSPIRFTSNATIRRPGDWGGCCFESNINDTSCVINLIKIFGNEQVHIEFSRLRHALGGVEPITRTLVRLLQEGYPTYEESAEVGSHYTEQIRMLLDLGYAEYKPSVMDPNARLVATNKLKGIYMHEKTVDRTIDVVLGMVLSEFYYDLQKEMRIFQLVPYVKASTGYYSNAVQFGKLLRMSESRLKNVTREFYRGVPLTKRVNYGYSTIVSGLVDAKILDYDGDYITGREDIFNKLIDMRSELPINEEPVILG
jgi:hypothetical protein